MSGEELQIDEIGKNMYDNYDDSLYFLIFSCVSFQDSSLLPPTTFSSAGLGQIISLYLLCADNSFVEKKRYGFIQASYTVYSLSDKETRGVK